MAKAKLDLKLISEQFDVYLEHAKDHLSSHSLIDYISNPLVYKLKYITGEIPQVTDNASMLFGSAFHLLILQPTLFHKLVYIGEPINERTGKSYGAKTKEYTNFLRDRSAEGYEYVVTSDDYITMMKMCDGIVNNKEARQWFTCDGKQTYIESTIRGKMDGVKVQARIDLFNEHGMFDLKTVSSIDKFKSQVKTYHYDLQMAFYRLVLSSLTGSNSADIPVFLVAVEKQQPFACVLYRMHEDYMLISEITILEALAKYKISLRDDEWLSTIPDYEILVYNERSYDE